MDISCIMTLQDQIQIKFKDEKKNKQINFDLKGFAQEMNKDGILITDGHSDNGWALSNVYAWIFICNQT